MESKTNSSLIERNSIRHRFKGRSHNTCSICLAKTKRGEEVRRLPCLHLFHVVCVDTWLSENDICPMCRQCIKEVTGIDEKDEVIVLSNGNPRGSRQQSVSSSNVVEIIDIAENYEDYEYLDDRDDYAIEDTINRQMRANQRIVHSNHLQDENEDGIEILNSITPFNRPYLYRNSNPYREIIHVPD